MSKHTPDAWTVDRSGGGVKQYNNSLGTYLHDMLTVRAGRVHICTLSRSVDGTDPTASGPDHHAGSWDELHANADLIAAAPELLKALIKAEAKLLELEGLIGGGDDEISVETEILLARAAIAKAEGAV